MTTDHTTNDVRLYLSRIGKRGGKSKSAKKLASGRLNAAKATAARIAKLALRNCVNIPTPDKP